MTADVQPKTVPYHFLGPPGVFNPTLLLFVSGLTLLIGSTYGALSAAAAGLVFFCCEHSSPSLCRYRHPRCLSRRRPS